MKMVRYVLRSSTEIQSVGSQLNPAHQLVASQWSLVFESSGAKNEILNFGVAQIGVRKITVLRRTYRYRYRTVPFSMVQSTLEELSDQGNCP